MILILQNSSPHSLGKLSASDRGAFGYIDVIYQRNVLQTVTNSP